MMYIKTFEGLFDFFKKKKSENDEDNLFKEMTIQEKDTWAYTRKSENFTKGEMDIIKNYFTEKEWEQKEPSTIFPLPYTMIYRKYKPSILIMKYTDEWYIVEVCKVNPEVKKTFNSIIHLHPNNRNAMSAMNMQSVNNIDKYYLCDQFDALEQCLDRVL